MAKLEKVDKYEKEKAAIREIFDIHKNRLGYRRVTDQLSKRNLPLNHKTVLRLMRELGLFCRVRNKRYNSYRGDASNVAENVLNRNFKAHRPNEKWVTDITEFRMYGQKIYLSPILDLFNGEIISYQVSNHPRFNQVLSMLDQAFDKTTDTQDLILHSDQGWQYRMKEYQDKLAGKGIKQSMSRKGNCYDNAVIENFFGHLKAELLYNQTFQSVDHFIEELHGYIEYYNFIRTKRKLGYLSPVEFRLLHEAA